MRIPFGSLRSLRSLSTGAAALVLALALSQTALAGRGGSVGALREAVASGSPDTIVAEVERAEKLTCLSCVDVVRPLVDHPDRRVRRVAAWWLAKRGAREEVVATMSARLTGTDPVAAAHAAEALGEMRNPLVVPQLSAYVARPLDGASGAAAAAALGEIGHPTARPALEAALSSSLPEVRAAAARSLRSLRDGITATPLLPLIADPVEQVRVEAIYTVGSSGDPAAIAALAKCLSTDASATVRKHAAWALGQLGAVAGGAAAIPALQGAASDADPFVRSVARASLARLR